MPGDAKYDLTNVHRICPEAKIDACVRAHILDKTPSSIPGLNLMRAAGTIAKDSAVSQNSTFYAHVIYTLSLH